MALAEDLPIGVRTLSITRRHLDQRFAERLHVSEATVSREASKIRLSEQKSGA
jgi:hypothetical protein